MSLRSLAPVLLALGFVAAGAAPLLAQEEPLAAGSEGVPVPKKTKHVQPTYPQEALAQGIRGIVILDLVVDGQGKVEATNVVRSVPGLDEAAIAAARQWEYEPTKVGGKAVRVRITVPITFALALPQLVRQDGIPELRQGVTPAWPAGAGGGGMASAEVTLEADGRVGSAQVLEGGAPWSAALLAALRTWRFSPPPDDSVLSFRIEAEFVSAGGSSPQGRKVGLKATGLQRSGLMDEPASAAAAPSGAPAAPAASQAGNPPAATTATAAPPPGASPEAVAAPTAIPAPVPTAPANVEPPKSAPPQAAPQAAQPAAQPTAPSSPPPAASPSAPPPTPPSAPQASRPSEPAPGATARPTSSPVSQAPVAGPPPASPTNAAPVPAAPAVEVITAPPPAPTPENGVSAIRDVTLEPGVPDLTKGRRPVVPPLARMAGTSGSVEVSFSVSAGGTTTVQSATGPDLLRPAAEQAVASWIFRRARADRAYLVALFTSAGDKGTAVVRPAGAPAAPSSAPAAPAPGGSPGAAAAPPASSAPTPPDSPKPPPQP